MVTSRLGSASVTYWQAPRESDGDPGRTTGTSPSQLLCLAQVSHTNFCQQTPRFNPFEKLQEYVVYNACIRRNVSH